jgi:pyruvate formate lyase activating enzyme
VENAEFGCFDTENCDNFEKVDSNRLFEIEGDVMESEQIKGTVFDIRKNYLAEQDEVQTTFWLKGCQMSCIWCNHPEGINARTHPVYLPYRCIRSCSNCLERSKHGGIRSVKGEIQVDALQPENWEDLIAVCPTGALGWDSQHLSVQDAVRIVLDQSRDTPAAHMSVFLAGGEPLLQADFAAEFLRTLKEMNVETGLETALFVPMESVLKVEPYLDHVYADLKLFDGLQHRKYTGVPNGRIKKNIQLLLESARRQHVVVRTSLISEVTAQEENIAAISRYIAGIYEDVTYEIRNYNPLSQERYPLAEHRACFAKNMKPYSAQQIQKFANIARENGVRNVIEGI